MDWLRALFTDTNAVAHIILVYALVVALGTLLGRIKVAGISLGVTFVLFVGLAAGHFGLTVPEPVLFFIRDFGLTLFIFFRRRIRHHSGVKLLTRLIRYEFYHLFDIFITDHRALNTLKLCSGHHQQHVTTAKQRLRSITVKYHTAVHLTRYRKTYPRRKIRLDQTCYHILTRTLRRNYYVDAGRTTLSRYTVDARFNFTSRLRHHQIRQLIQNYYQYRQLLRQWLT